MCLQAAILPLKTSSEHTSIRRSLATGEIDSAASEIDREPYAWNIGGLIRCSDLIFDEGKRNGVGGKLDRCRGALRYKEKETETPLTKSRQSRKSIFSVSERLRERKFAFGGFRSDRWRGPRMRRDAGYSRNSKVYSSLERLVALTWFLSNEANN